MYVTKKHLPRRTVLRGLGAAIGLPLLGRDDSGGHRAGADGRDSRSRTWDSSTSRTAR